MQILANSQGAIVAYMPINEAVAIAAPALLCQQANTTTNTKRQRELIAVRVLLYCALNKSIPIVYDQHRKPHLADNSYHIGISHTSQWVAIILHPTKHVGIDIETIMPRVGKVRAKFLSDIENQSVLPNDYTTLTTYWCAKETAYKWYGKKEVDFATHLKITIDAPCQTPQHQIISTLPIMLDMPNLTQTLLVHYTLILPDVVIAWVVA